MVVDTLDLYGGKKPWDASCWIDSDDRVRGGASRSYLSVTDDDRRTARFHGTLDTETLGGAGFASQHSRGELALDLGGYDGILISFRDSAEADGKWYALTLKDDIPPRRDDGCEQAGISWEAVFCADRACDVKLRWSDFKPTYRGRPAKDAKPLKLQHIKRIGLMMRSFFGKQSGEFSLHLHGIAAWKTQPESRAEPSSDDEDDDEIGQLKAGLSARCARAMVNHGLVVEEPALRQDVMVHRLLYAARC